MGIFNEITIVITELRKKINVRFGHIHGMLGKS
jgi:hypothetical protein